MILSFLFHIWRDARQQETDDYPIRTPHMQYGRRIKVCHPPFLFLYNIVFHMLQLSVTKLLTYNGANIISYIDFIAFGDILVYHFGCLVMLNFPFGYFLIISFDKTFACSVVWFCITNRFPIDHRQSKKLNPPPFGTTPTLFNTSLTHLNYHFI